MRRTFSFFTVLTILFVISSPGFGQVVIEELTKPKTTVEKVNQMTRVKTILEGPIDPEKYVLGPGDKLAAGILGSVFFEEIPLMVLPEGIVIVPGAGSISVKGKTISEARRLITDKLSRLHLETEITVTLTEVRAFKVYITGEVMFPGEYYANPTTRVTSIIQQAGGFTEWSDGRSVEIQKHGKPEVLFDYVQYIGSGIKENNPVLEDGDLIFVPNKFFEKGTILLRLANGDQQYYQFYEDETINKFLNRIEIEPQLFDWSGIKITRLTDDKSEEIINLDLVNNSNNELDASRFTLHANDIITIPYLNRFVFVQGSVENPGAILWSPDQKASYYVGNAGKTNEAVKNNRITLIRDNKEEDIKNIDPVVFPGDIIIVPKRRIFVFKEYMEFVTPLVSIIIAAKAVGIIK